MWMLDNRRETYHWRSSRCIIQTLLFVCKKRIIWKPPFNYVPTLEKGFIKLKMYKRQKYCMLFMLGQHRRWSVDPSTEWTSINKTSSSSTNMCNSLVCSKCQWEMITPFTPHKKRLSLNVTNYDYHHHHLTFNFLIILLLLYCLFFI